jgi:hypothetical protein
VLDYEIIQIVRPLIIDGLTAQGIDSKVLMNYQPTKQGKQNNTVYFFVVNDKNVGSLERQSYWDSDLNEMVYTEAQQKETMFQVNTIVKQDPSNLTITAKDLCTKVQMILESRKVLDILSSNDMGLLRITDIRNTPFEDDDENYSYNPSFDFVITHKEKITSDVPIIDTFNYDIRRI